MSQCFNAKLLAQHAPPAREVYDIHCPDFDGEAVFRVQEPDGSALVTAYGYVEQGNSVGMLTSLLADCVVDEKGRRVFSYKTAADFLMQFSGKLTELTDKVNELAEQAFGDVEAKEEVTDPQNAAQGT